MNQNPNNANITIFDVCHTLFTANTTAGFISHLQRRRGSLRQRLLVQAIRNRLSPVRYAALIYSKLTKHDAPRDILISTLAGYPSGDQVVLVSNSLDIVIQAIAERFACESVASKLAIENGVCKGRLTESLTGKKHIAVQELLETPNANITVCTDNRSDVELLRRANRRIVVHHKPPAEELKRVATEFINVE